MKINVINLEEFLQEVARCGGPVYLLHEDGRKEPIKGRGDAQDALYQQHKENHGSLWLSLKVPNHRDYLRLVYFTVGDC